MMHRWCSEDAKSCPFTRPGAVQIIRLDKQDMGAQWDRALLLVDIGEHRKVSSTLAACIGVELPSAAWGLCCIRPALLGLPASSRVGGPCTHVRLCRTQTSAWL